MMMTMMETMIVTTMHLQLSLHYHQLRNVYAHYRSNLVYAAPECQVRASLNGTTIIFLTSASCLFGLVAKEMKIGSILSLVARSFVTPLPFVIHRGHNVQVDQVAVKQVEQAAVKQVASLSEEDMGDAVTHLLDIIPVDFPIAMEDMEDMVMEAMVVEVMAVMELMVDLEAMVVMEAMVDMEAMVVMEELEAMVDTVTEAMVDMVAEALV